MFYFFSKLFGVNCPSFDATPITDFRSWLLQPKSTRRSEINVDDYGLDYGLDLIRCYLDNVLEAYKS